MISLSDSPACQEYGTMPLGRACIWCNVQKIAKFISDCTHGSGPGFTVLYQLQKKKGKAPSNYNFPQISQK